MNVIPGIVRWSIFQLDEFNKTISVGIDLTGKTLLCQVRETPDSLLALEFKESDGSMVVTPWDGSKTIIQLLKHSHEMNIPVLPTTVPKSLYSLTIIAYTEAEEIDDTMTFVYGTLDVLPQYTIIL